MSDLASIGIITDPDKCRVNHTGSIKFMGLAIDFIGKTLYREDLGLLRYEGLKEEKIAEYLKAAGNIYSLKVAKQDP